MYQKLDRNKRLLVLFVSKKYEKTEIHLSPTTEILKPNISKIPPPSQFKR